MSIVPLTTLGYFNVQTAKHNLEGSIGQQMNLGAKRLGADLELLIGRKMDNIATFSGVAGARLLKEEHNVQEGILYTMLKEIPSLEEVSLINGKGQIIAGASRRQVIDKDSNQIDQTKEIEQQKIGQLEKGTTFLDLDGQVRLKKLIPIKQIEKGENVGGFLIEMSLREVMSELTKRQLANEGRIFVINQEGQLIAHEDFSQVLRQANVETILPIQEFLSNSSTLENGKALRYFSYDQTEVLGAWARVPYLDWAVIQEVPIKTAFAPINILIGQVALGGLGLILLATSISIFFGVGFGRSLKTLEEGVEEISKGNLEKPLSIEGKNELFLLGETINRMRQELLLKRQQEEILWQAEKLSSLGLLASGIAHEVNNPLGVMLAHAQDLQERLEEESPEDLLAQGEVQDYLDIIIKQTKRCKEITGGLLDYAGHTKKTITKVNLQKELTATLRLLDYPLKKQGIEVEISLPENLPFLTAGQGELQQILLNIFTNAVDAMPYGGKIKVTGSINNEKLIIKVEDQGQGIKKEELRKIFEPFYTTKETGKGTGLGLPISISIMERLGGKLELESSSEGTIVYLTFPLREGEQDDCQYFSS